jgi:hypothetical protein
LPIEPLTARETARIAEARLGVDHLPEALAKLIVAKTEGNALFAEEITSFVIERSIVRRTATGLDFDPAAVAAALPQSVQLLLASRVDRLAPSDRNLLQTAAVAGRRFDPDLVAVVGDAGGDAQASFAAMEALDLIHRVEASGDYVFKHALVRDALYSGLLSPSRAALHLKVAEELERRGGNRLSEIAEVLAHHYVETASHDKAFAYLAMAGDKSLYVYSNEEAEQYYRKALTIFEAHKACADQPAVVTLIVRLLETLNHKSDYQEMGQVARHYIPFVRESGENCELVIASYYEGLSLLQTLDFRGAHELAVEMLGISERLGDGRARAYAGGLLLFTRIVLGLDSLEVADRMKAKLIDDSLQFGDNFIRIWAYWFVAWDYLYRGLFKEAKDTAVKLIRAGQDLTDPRALGLASETLGYIQVVADDPLTAMAHADDCLRVAVTPLDRLQGEAVKAMSSILIGRAREGLDALNAVHSEFERLRMRYAILYGPKAVALAMLGQISEGVRLLKKQISRSDELGHVGGGAWERIILAEIYIEILSGRQKPPTSVVLKNFWTIIGVICFGAQRARKLLQRAAEVSQLSEQGAAIARIKFDLGSLAAINKKRDEARSYFKPARIGAESQGAGHLLQKIDAALEELQRGQ